MQLPFEIINEINDFPNTSNTEFGPFLNFMNGELELKYIDHKHDEYTFMFYDVMNFSLIDSQNTAVRDYDEQRQYNLKSSDPNYKSILIGFNDNGGTFVYIEYSKMVRFQ
jgi:hypothetical protein